jgi:PAS domain S-box-containing protein
MIDRQRIREFWEDFVHYRQLRSAVRKEIQEAWLRSKAYRVDPYAQTVTKKLFPCELEQLKRKKKTFIRASAPKMESLYSIVKGSGFLVMLADESGYLLRMIGDEELLQEAEKVGCTEGSLWSEEAMGANAIGTCIATGKPIQFWDSEHYVQMGHLWTCSAAPIHDASGRLTGVLNVAGPGEKVHPHTLVMVISTASAIEKQMETEKDNEMIKNVLRQTPDMVSEGTILIDAHGKIIMTNHKLQQMIGMEECELAGKHVTDIFANEMFFELPFLQNDLHDQEITLKMVNSSKQIPVLFSSKNISQYHKKIGTIWTIKESRQARKRNDIFSENEQKVMFHNILGKSKPFRQKKLEAKVAARSDSNVLLMDESGTGKSMFALAIHHESDRRDKPFIVIHCGGNLAKWLKSGLFADGDGAVLGTRRAEKTGFPDGATVFLDQIEELPPEMQLHLSMMLQKRGTVRNGPGGPRIIAAANKNLCEDVKKGNFRQDLFLLLNAIPIHLPPLRDRKEDIPLLAAYFIEKLAKQLDRPCIRVSPSFYNILQLYDWPGNISELQLILQRAIVRASGNEIGMEALPVDLSVKMMPRENRSVPIEDKLKKQALLSSVRM